MRSSRRSMRSGAGPGPGRLLTRTAAAAPVPAPARPRRPRGRRRVPRPLTPALAAPTAGGAADGQIVDTMKCVPIPMATSTMTTARYMTPATILALIATTTLMEVLSIGEVRRGALWFLQASHVMPGMNLPFMIATAAIMEALAAGPARTTGPAIVLSTPVAAAAREVQVVEPTRRSGAQILGVVHMRPDMSATRAMLAGVLDIVGPALAAIGRKATAPVAAIMGLADHTDMAAAMAMGTAGHPMEVKVLCEDGLKEEERFG